MSQNFRDIINELHIFQLDKYELEFEISRVFSANARWIPQVAYKKGKAYGYLRLAPEAATLKSEVTEKVRSIVPKVDYKKEVRAVVVKAEIALPADKVLLKDLTHLRRIDLSNMWQVIENGIVDGLGLDDSLTVDLHLEKTLSKDDKYYVRLEIKTYGV